MIKFPGPMTRDLFTVTINVKQLLPIIGPHLQCIFRREKKSGISYFVCLRWLVQGSTSQPRQGAVMTVLDGKPTLLGGFHDYDKYPTMVEQFDTDTGNKYHLNQASVSSRRSVIRFLVPTTK